MKHLNSYLKTVDISSLKEYFIKNGCLVQYSEGDVFQEEGLHVKRFGFLVNGSVRYCCNSHEGRSHIVGYAFDDAFIGDYSAFLSGKKSGITIKVAEETAVYVLTVAQLVEFINLKPENLLLFKNMAEDMFLTMRDRLLTFYTMSPEERYIKLLHDTPYLLNRISLKEIASFIGVTPEALSRIRRRIMKRDNRACRLPGGVACYIQNLKPSLAPALQLMFSMI